MRDEALVWEYGEGRSGMEIGNEVVALHTHKGR